MDYYDLVILAMAGFLAQIVDGALGMAYGTLTSALLLAWGLPPVNVSAAVHTAQVFTCAASGASHIAYKNVIWRIVLWLAIPGVLGAVIGALVLTHVDGTTIRPWISIYLAALGLLIVARAFRKKSVEAPRRDPAIAPVGFAGAFLDTVGGGGWGPIVTTTLVGRGHEPRFAVGSVNVAEFIVKTSASASFLMLIGLTHAPVVLALLAGGVVAAPFGGYLAKHIPPKPFMVLVGTLVISLSVWQIGRLLLG
jgi:hypothetical protein